MTKNPSPDIAKPITLSEDETFALGKFYGLNEEEVAKLIAAQKKSHDRWPTATEIAICGALWSEHCSYKSSKLHIKKLHFNEPWVITAMGENAGAIDIGDGEAIIFKMESHNHPSYLEPFNGAATGVGGILRDIFTMGAKPIANLNSLRFGNIDDKKFGKKMRGLVRGVVRGISHYGNCVGVPMVMGEAEFLPCYNGNILVNAMTVGLVKHDNIASAMAKGFGNWVVYLGSKTGRDGVKGAVMASQEFVGDGDTSGKPAVQVGDPFAEKLLMDICLQLIVDKKFIAIQDMGAAGLSSSAAEMADKGGVGLQLWLDKVPTREAGLRPEDMMLSESQERMLAIIEPDDFDAIKKIFARHHLDCEKIGEVVGGKSLLIDMDGEQVANLETNLLVEQAPLYDRPQSPLPKYLSAPKIIDKKSVKEYGIIEVADYLKKYFSSPFGGDKSFIYEQYDRLVQGNVIFSSGQASAGVIKIENSNKAIAASSHGDPLLCHANPAVGGRAIILESYRKICAVGARPLAYTNNLNFGNPENPDVMAEFATILTAMGAVSRELKFPTISGNVSFYNQTAGRDIYPTPVIGGVGLLADYKKAVGYILKPKPQTLWLLGDGLQSYLAASRYEFLQANGEEMTQDAGQEMTQDATQETIQNMAKEFSTSPPPEIFDAGVEKKLGDFVQKIIHDGLASSCKSVGAGGWLVDIITMGLQNNMTLNLSNDEKSFSNEYFFGIGGARYIIATDDDSPDGKMIEKLAADAALPIKKLGTALPAPSPDNAHLTINGETIILMQDIKTHRQNLKNKIII